jgi:hypothetical protein
MSDQLVAEAATYTTKKETTIHPSVGFEPAIPAIKRLQTNALEGTAKGIGKCYVIAMTNPICSDILEIHKTENLQRLKFSNKNSCPIKSLEEITAN